MQMYFVHFDVLVPLNLEVVLNCQVVWNSFNTYISFADSCSNVNLIMFQLVSLPHFRFIYIYILEQLSDCKSNKILC